MNEMKYLRPRLPEKEIELCLDLFDKQEAKKRILKYIEGVFDDAESQLKNCFIHDVVGQSEQFISLIRELIDVGIINEDDIEVETWVNNYLKEIN